jgi:hypothetical protein
MGEELVDCVEGVRLDGVVCRKNEEHWNFRLAGKK